MTLARLQPASPDVGVRASRRAAAAVFVLAGISTAAILLVPELRVTLRLPRTAEVISTASVIVALMTSILSYLHYSVTGARAWLMIGVAFAVLGMNQLVFGVVLSARLLGTTVPVFLWSAGRIVVAALLLAGAILQRRHRDRPPQRPFVRFSASVLAGMAVLAAADGILWGIRGSLPPIELDAAGTPAVGSLWPALLAVGAVGTAMYLVGALLYLWPADAAQRTPWLGPALVIAAFSHVHYTLSPTAFTEQMSTGNFLGLAFAAALFLGVAFDVRSALRAERDRTVELEQGHREASRRVGELEETDRLRVRLIGIVTHELLHPIAAIRGYAVTLTKRWRDLPEEVRRDAVERIERQIEHLRHLAEETALVAEVDADVFSVSVREVPAASLVHEATEAAQEVSGRLRLTIEPGAERAVILADGARLQQVFRNLLSNADKYSRPGSLIHLTVEAPADGHVRFSVADRGPGIPSSRVEEIFAPYSRLGRSRDDVQGSGLGLYISRQIVEEHGGRLWAESDEGVGSTFYFTLPMKKP